MKCEKCGEEHNGEYGSGRFCNSKCARGFSTIEKRKEINRKVSKLLSGYRCVKGGKIKLCDYGCGQDAKYQLGNGKWCCKPSYNKCPRMKQVNSDGLKKVSCNFTREDRLKGNKNYKDNLKTHYQDLLFEEKPIAEQRRIVLKKQNGKCMICGIDTWCGKPLRLHLDHINGNIYNNNRENLRYICPNCHSQTPTYCKPGNKKGKLNGQKVEDQYLIKVIQETSSVHQTLIKCGLTPKGNNYQRIYNLIAKYKLKFTNEKIKR